MRKCGMMVIGGSAGALDVLIRLIGRLRADLAFPVLIVLHRANNHDSTLAEVLQAKSGLKIQEIDDKDPIVPGVIYLVPSDYHVLIERDKVFSLDASEKVNYSRPSIDVTFESVAEVYRDTAVAILLSGGNADGAAGLKKIRGLGGRTAVQDPKHAQVPYMPEQALSATAIDFVLHPDEIAGFINGL